MQVVEIGEATCEEGFRRCPCNGCLEEAVECPATPMCGATEFCDFATSCGTEGGVCMPRPSDCPTDGEPVCGCDGLTYSSGCEAARGGVGVRHSGGC